MLRVFARTLVAVLQLEGVTCHRDNGDVDPLASQGLQALMQIQALLVKRNMFASVCACVQPGEFLGKQRIPRKLIT